MKKPNPTTIDLPKELKKEVRKAAIDAECSFKDYLIQALTEKLKKPCIDISSMFNANVLSNIEKKLRVNSPDILYGCSAVPPKKGSVAVYIDKQYFYGTNAKNSLGGKLKKDGKK